VKRLLLLVPAVLFLTAEFPVGLYPECGLGGECPSDFDPDGDWNLSSTIPPSVSEANIPADQRDLGSGLWADRAWALTTGRPDVLIAVTDSGIKWDESQLLNKHYIHTAELPVPDGYPQDEDGAHRDTFDFDGNGVVNMADWAQDARVTPDLGVNATEHPDGVKDPSDLIALFSDGVDDDGNGFIDDIAGWDFFWNDNNPYDDTRYGHGTGEAKDSVAEANNGGDIGVCPNCMVLNLRVGDSFVADVDNFAMAVTYAVDMGADVVQEALGTINNTQLTIDAIDYAWERGVTIMASAADETSYHQNYPANNHHTVYIHAIRYDSDDREDADTFFSYSNCTNHGGHLVLSAPSTSCSSGAVGVGAGMAGLIYSAGRDAVEDGTLDGPLTANEVFQVMNMTVDDIAFVPEDDHPTQYPSREGWDHFFGYGRTNAFKAVSMIYDGDVPPEADILAPTWFEVLNVAAGSSVDIEGYAAADRAGSFTWDLQVAPGIDPDEARFESFASGSETSAVQGVLGRLDLRSVDMDPAAPIERYRVDDNNVEKEHKIFVHAATLRLQVTDDAGRMGEMRKSVFIHEDPDLLPGFPARVAVSVESSPTLVDLDGDGLDDVIFVTSDGRVRVTNAALESKPGWPQLVPLLDEFDAEHPGNHLDQPAYADGLVAGEARHSVLATPAVGDLDGDGQLEVVVATLNGQILAWHADGTAVAGFPFVMDLSLVLDNTDPENTYDYGFFSTPALGDLDNDGTLEIVVGGMDAHVYALRHDGTAAAGFPVELRHTYDTSNGPTSKGERIISSPALGDADGDGFLEIAIGTNQKTTGTYGLGYLLSHDGQVEEGWPYALFGAYTNALPYVGEGVPGCPSMCDVDGDGDLEIAMHTIADSGKILSHDGTEFALLDRLADNFGPLSNTDEDAANLIMINSGAWGDIDADGRNDYVIGSVGFDYANGLIDDGIRHDHDHLLSAWSGVPDTDVPGTPRLHYMTGFPQMMEDLQFFLNPAVADIDGDGLPEAINGSAGHIVHAFNVNGVEPAGWPKQTGQWILGSPAVGDADGDGYLEVWTGTRSGFLYAWKTTSLASEAYRGWTGFRHDPANTGNCHTALRTYEPLPPVEEGCGACEGEGSMAGGRGLGVLAIVLGLLGFVAVRRR
jgi:hypothetical protein